MKSLDRPHPILRHVLLLSLFAWLLLIMLLASHSAAVQPAASSLPPAVRARNAVNAPVVTYTTYLPLIQLAGKIHRPHRNDHAVEHQRAALRQIRDRLHHLDHGDQLLLPLRSRCALSTRAASRSIC